MKFEFTIKKAVKPTHTNTLNTNRGVWVGTTVDWSGDGAIISLDPADMAALQRKHETKNVNYARATQVKRMMLDGMKQVRIIQALRGMGRGYGERMIKADYAALSGPLKRARKKVQ